VVFGNYAEVSQRIPLFWKDHPKGRISTTITNISPDFSAVVMRAEIYREGEGEPFATGYA
jgi:hypothetical protein